MTKLVKASDYARVVAELADATITIGQLETELQLFKKGYIAMNEIERIDPAAGADKTVVRMYVDLNEVQAMALAQFLKRVGFGEMRKNAVDDHEAYVIREVLAMIQKGLADVGFAPR